MEKVDQAPGLGIHKTGGPDESATTVVLSPAHHPVLMARLTADGEFPTYDLPNFAFLIWLGLLGGV